MTKEQAIELIKNAIPQGSQAQKWVDLGCGAGAFTEAMANLLPKGSQIYAVDNQQQTFPKLLGNGVSIDFIKADFENTPLDFENLDGIMMANSLHYIQNKQTLILRLEKYLSNNKQFIIIEYDTNLSNPWVPFPINYEQLKELFSTLGNRKIRKIATHLSIYGQGEMYVALVSCNDF